MKVKELIEQLQNMNPNADVHFAYNYGDYWKTTVAPQIDKVEEGYVRHSDYHNMDAVLDMDRYELEDDQELVVILEA